MHEQAIIWLFQVYLRISVESFVATQVELTDESTKAQQGFLTSYLVMENYLLKDKATGDNIATVDVRILTFEKQSVTATNYEQKLWIKMLGRRSVYTRKRIKGLFVDVADE